MISVRFVGRDAEMRLLAGHLDAARSGRGSVVLLRGPAGVGKTRLVEEAIRDVAIPVGRGYTVDDPGTPPLWCWMQACATAGLAEVVELLRDPHLSGDSDEEAAARRFRWLADVADTLATHGSPSILVLEDVHWADRTTLELLRAVGSVITDSPLAVIATSRPADPGRETQYGLLERFPATATMDLPPLSVADVAALLDTTPQVAEHVHAETHGLPLLVAVGEGREAELHRIALALVAQAGPRLRPEIEAAAVLGEWIDEPLLAAVLGHPPDRQALARSGLLVPDGTRFVHALIRDEIAATVPPDRAEEIHTRAAAHLMERPRPNAAAITAHLVAAGDGRAAGRWARTAAEESSAARAYEDAASFLRIVEESEVAARADPAALARTRLALARTTYLTGRPQDALEQCRAVASGTEDPDVLAAAALVVREVAFPEADETNIEIAQRALAKDLVDDTRARLLAQLATAYANTNRLEDSARVAAEAWETAQRSGDPAALLAAAQAREATMLGPDDDPERLAIAKTAAEQAETLGQPVARSLALGWHLRAAYALADLAEVGVSIDELTSLTARSGLPLLRWRLARTMAAVSALEGRFAEAQASNEEARRLGLAAGDPVAGLLSDALAIYLGLVRGRPDGVPELGDIPLPPRAVPIAISRRAAYRLTVGDDQGARQDYARLRPLLWGPGRVLQAGGVLIDLATLADHFEDAEAALAIVVQLTPWLSVPGVVGIPMAYFAPPTAANIGRCLMVAGRPDEAVPHLRRAIGQSEQVRARPYAAQARCDLAEALLRTGGAGEARGLLAEARREAGALDMPGLLAKVDELTSADHGPLSPREAEIAALVLEALPNRAIADRLVISERTVETHVRSVLGKFGCANRAELIARRSELGL